MGLVQAGCDMGRRNRWTAGLGCALVLAATAAGAQDRIRQAAEKLGFINPDEPVTVQAQKHRMDNRTGIWNGSGGVTISNSSLVVHADEVTLNQQTGDVQARGNVRLSRPGFAEWTGERLAFNHRTGAGLADASQVKAGRFTVQADRSERRPDGDIVFKGVRMSTCTNAPDFWHWHLTTGEVTYRPSRSLSAWHGAVWFFGVPVAYVPYWYRDLDTHYGVRLLPGYTSDWGVFALGRYVYPYLHGPDGLGLTGQARFDLRSKRGVGAGHDFRWDFGRFGKGGLQLYYAQDEDPERLRHYPGRDARNDRSRIALSHEADLTPKDRVFVKGQALSDSEFLEEFFEAEYRRSVQPDNVVSYTHRESDAAGGVTVSGPLDDFYDGVRRLPEAWLNVMPQPLLPGLYYESQNRAGYLQKQTAPRDPGILPLRGPEYAVFRADTAHRLSLPFWLGVVRLVPRAGYRGTYYRHAWVEDSGNVRNLFELGAEASAKAIGTVGAYRHIVEPYADYSWIPRPHDLEDGENYVFDRVDSGLEWRDGFGFDGVPLWRQWHGVRLGVRNALQHPDADKQLQTVVDSDLYSAYTFGSDGEPQGVRIVGGVVEAKPVKNFRLRTAMEYDPEDNELRLADNGFTWSHPRWELSAGHFYRHDVTLDAFGVWTKETAAHLLYVGARHLFNDIWSAGCDVRYEYEQGRLQEIMGYVEYRLDCLAFQIRTGYEPEWADINGRVEDANFKFGLVLTLRGMEDRFGLAGVHDDLQF